MGRYGTTITCLLAIICVIAFAVAAFMPSYAQTEADCLAYQREIRAVPATGANMDEMRDYGCTYGPTDRWHVTS